MKSKIVSFLASALVIGALLIPQIANAKTPVIIASSVDTSEQNYINVTYKKFVELAQQYSDNAFDFQLFPSSLVMKLPLFVPHNLEHCKLPFWQPTTMLHLLHQPVG